jgi:glyceraldehyde-3-phosphate dehydrogenase/erythrose-4-phosphate dehydrogenase
MAVKVGINGFGRIGRNVLRASLNDPNIEFCRGQRPYRPQDSGPSV